jgi:hypothetical protein
MNKTVKRTTGVVGVVLFIALSCTVIYLHWTNVRHRACALQCAHNLRRLALAIEAYQEVTGHYPPDERPLSESLRDYIASKEVLSRPCRRQTESAGYDACYYVTDCPNGEQLFRLECPNHGNIPGSAVHQRDSCAKSAFLGFGLPSAEASPSLPVATTAGSSDLSFVSLASDGVVEVRRPWGVLGRKVFFAPECFVKGTPDQAPSICPLPATSIVGVAQNALSLAAWECGGVLCEEVIVLHGRARIVAERSAQPKMLRPGESVFFVP